MNRRDNSNFWTGTSRSCVVFKRAHQTRSLRCPFSFSLSVALCSQGRQPRLRSVLAPELESGYRPYQKQYRFRITRRMRWMKVLPCWPSDNRAFTFLLLTGGDSVASAVSIPSFQRARSYRDSAPVNARRSPDTMSSVLRIKTFANCRHPDRVGTRSSNTQFGASRALDCSSAICSGFQVESLPHLV